MKSLPTVLLLPAAAISMLSSVPAGAEQAVAPAAVPTADAAAAQPATATAVATPEAAPAVAATAPAASQETAPACELHVFPTLEGAAVTTGWGVGFGMIGAMIEASANKDRNVRDAAYLKEALGPRLQVEALKTVDVPKALKFEPAQVRERSETERSGALPLLLFTPFFKVSCQGETFGRAFAIFSLPPAVWLVEQTGCP